jgi:hypothetical protein
MLVKASTGINDRAVCDQMIAAGACVWAPARHIDREG